MAGVKGKSGRQKNELPFRHALMEKLDQIDPSKDRKRLYVIADKLVEEAEAGEAWAIKEIMDRVDGKPKAAVDVSHDVTDPLQDLLRSIAMNGGQIGA